MAATAAEKYFPFRSKDGDRKYSAEDWAAYFAQFIGTGVFYDSADRLKVVTNGGMNVKAVKGAGFVAGRMYILQSDKIITLDTADGALSRIDRIVLRCDYSSRQISTEVVKGTYSASPTAPALTRNADVYELALADVYVAAGVVEITTANITDQRLNKELCGIVTGLVEQADTQEIFNQFSAYFEECQEEWEADFNEWFDSVRNTLGEDAAGQLLQLVEANKADIADINSKIANHRMQTFYNVSELGISSWVLADIINAMPNQSKFMCERLDIVSNNPNCGLPNTSGTVTINKHNRWLVEIESFGFLGDHYQWLGNKNTLNDINLKIINNSLNYNGGANAHDITAPGIHTVGAECANLPFDTGWGILIVSNLDNNPAYTNHLLFSVDNNRWYAKQCENGTWPDTWVDNFNGLKIQTSDGMVGLSSNNEGGNVWLHSPLGAVWEMDANNEDFRVFRYPNANGDYKCFWFHKSGAMSVPGTIYSNGKEVPTVGTKIWEHTSGIIDNGFTVNADLSKYREIEVIYNDSDGYVYSTGRLPLEGGNCYANMAGAINGSNYDKYINPPCRDFMYCGGTDGFIQFLEGYYSYELDGEKINVTDATTSIIPSRIIAY